MFCFKHNKTNFKIIYKLLCKLIKLTFNFSQDFLRYINALFKKNVQSDVVGKSTGGIANLFGFQNCIRHFFIESFWK